MDRMELVDKMEEAITEQLGFEGEHNAFVAISKALDYDTKEDNYEYIIICNEIDFNYDDYEGKDRIERVDAMEEAILENLGTEGAFMDLSKALSYDTKEDHYEYIIRNYEVEFDKDEYDEPDI